MKNLNQQTKYIILSIIAHIFLFSGLYFFAIQKKNTNAPTEIVLLDAQDLEKLNQENLKNNARTIVESDEKTANEKINEKAKFLSAKNNSVTKETAAQRGNKTKNSEQKLVTHTAKKQSLVNQPELTTAFHEKTKTQSLKADLFGEKFNAYEALEKKEAQIADRNQKRQVANMGANSNEASTLNEKLDGIDTSLKTALNTREYKYYGYYQRIKAQLNQFWQPQVRQKVTKLMQKGRTIASENSDKTTRLVIFLNTQGTLVKIQVLSESGVRDLDDAAIEAFRQAAPFPNPPKGIVDNDGTIKIRWDFVVES